jgi:hypothetical protein
MWKPDERLTLHDLKTIKENPSCPIYTFLWKWQQAQYGGFTVPMVMKVWLR